MQVVATVSLWLSGTGLVLMTAFVAWQVWGRFVLNDTPTWTESSSVLLMGWFILLGAAAGIREGNHLSFDILIYLIGQRATTIPNLGISGGVAFLALITGGGLMVLFSIERLLRRAVGLPNARFNEIDEMAE